MSSTRLVQFDQKGRQTPFRSPLAQPVLPQNPLSAVQIVGREDAGSIEGVDLLVVETEHVAEHRPVVGASGGDVTVRWVTLVSDMEVAADGENGGSAKGGAGRAGR